MRSSLVRRLKPACLLLASAASAQTTIGAATSANIVTSTASNGAPGDVTVTSAGTVSPPGGTAITIDSNNQVSNAGTISFHVIDNTIGIGTADGVSGAITNSGTIRNDDDYTATDTNGDGIVEGPLAQGTGHNGIVVGSSGAGFTGTISNSGTIAVEGNTSSAILATAPITGSLVNTGTITSLGDNDTTISLGRVNGGVTLNGTVSAQGTGSAAVVLGGDVGGNVVVHGTITSTGYSSTALPTSTTTLLPSNVMQGGSALTVAGNVAGGVLVGASLTSTTSTTADVDGDGIADVNEGAGAITTTGSAPALLIGSASNAITLGTVPSGSSGLVINGAVTGTGLVPSTSGTAVQIGGLGQSVTLTGGITVAGTVTGRANGGTAIAIYAASGAAIPTLTNSGVVTSNLTSTGLGYAQTVTIDRGATLSAIANSGTISASATAVGGLATAILDRSGTLASVANTGTISATDVDGNARTIDVSANTTGFSYTQAQSSSTTTTPSLSGAILTGSGADTIAASAGAIASNMSLGDGDNLVALSGTAAFTGRTVLGSGNDQLTLAGTATYTGTIDFGGGANSLSVGSGASFSGQILNSASNVALTVTSGGTANLTNTGTVALSSLTLGGTLGVTVNPSGSGSTVLQVAGATTIASGAALKVTLSSIALTPVSYTVLSSGSLSGSANLSLVTPTLPYLLTGTLTPNDAAGTIGLTIGPKTAAALGLYSGEQPAFPAVYRAIAGNTALSTLFSGLTDAGSTLRRVRQMLPAYEGGVFDVLSSTTRNLAPGLNAVPLAQSGTLSLWAQQAFSSNVQRADTTAGYKGTGFGIVGGADLKLGGFGRFGLSVGFLNASTKTAVATDASANVFQIGPHWIGRWGGLQLSANGAAGYARLSGTRAISGTDASNSALFTSTDRWHGLLLSGNAAASYELALGRLYLRPAGTLTYARLHENAHTGSGGGSAFDLATDARTTAELAVNGTLALGVQFGDRKDADATVVRVEAEGGRRSVLSSTIGTTTARFTGDTSSFTLDPEVRGSGYIGTLRATVGTDVLAVTASGSAETRDRYRAIVLRLGIRGSF